MVEEMLKQLAEIKEKVEAINGETSKKARKYEEQIDLLSHVKLKVKNVSISVNENGNHQLKVDYQVPSQFITFDSENNVLKNNTFYSINRLNLISFEDMAKIESKINEARKRNGNT